VHARERSFTQGKVADGEEEKAGGEAIHHRLLFL
jgi:hypothetical protein